MFQIKRTKTSSLPDALAPGVAAPPGRLDRTVTNVHWATAIAPKGNVTAWATEQEKALPVPEEVARKVAAFYANAANAGRIEAVAARPEATKANPAPRTEAEQAAELAATVQGLKDQIAALRRQLATQSAEVEESATLARSLTEENAALKVENAALKDRLSDVEAEPEESAHPAKRGRGRPKKDAPEENPEDHKHTENPAG